MDDNNASTTCNFTSTGLDSTARSMIDNAVYHLGGSSTARDYMPMIITMQKEEQQYIVAVQMMEHALEQQHGQDK